MEKLLEQWQEYSTKITQNTRRAEVIEEKIAELQRQLSGVETNVQRLQKEQGSMLVSTVRESAEALARRNYLQEGKFDPTVIAADREIISLYEKAETGQVKRLLQEGYDGAIRNEQERQRVSEPITAGVVFCPQDKKTLDLYVSIPYGGKEEGLVKNLSDSVINLLASLEKVSEVDIFDAQGVVKITVRGQYQELVEDLRKLNPEGFDAANVQYKAISVGEQLESEFTGGVGTPYRRFVEIESLRKLCDVLGEASPQTEAVVSPTKEGHSLGSIDEIVENWTADITSIEVGQPSSVRIPEAPIEQPHSSLDTAKEILGEKKYSRYASHYSVNQAEELISLTTSCLGKERAKLLLAADEKDQLIKQLRKLPRYLGRVNLLLSSLAEGYFEARPHDFLPSTIGNTEARVQSERVGHQAAEISYGPIAERMQCQESIVRGLVAEGYNPDYIHAMLRKGFDLGTNQPFIGEAYFPRRHWQRNLRRALASLGIKKIDERSLGKHEQIFRGMGLIRVKDKSPETCISLSSKWSDLTQGSALRDYLTAVMYRRN